MSLASLTSTSKATIRRVASASDSAMGQNRTYSTANRGSLPTSTTGRINQTAASRVFQFMQHESEVDAVWYTTTDPQCGVDAQDQLVIGSELWFVQWQRNPDEVSVFFMLGLVRKGAGVQ